MTPHLAPRQIECLRAMAIYGNRREAAFRVGLAESTFRNYLTRAYQQLGVEGDPHMRPLLRACRILGWLRVPSE